MGKPVTAAPQPEAPRIGKLPRELVAQINAAPEALRRYVMEIETQCDPAGTVREVVMLRDRCAQLEAALAAAAPAEAPPPATKQQPPPHRPGTYCCCLNGGKTNTCPVFGCRRGPDAVGEPTYSLAAPAEAPPADDLVARLRVVQTAVVDGRYLPLCEEAAARIESDAAKLAAIGREIASTLGEAIEWRGRYTSAKHALAARDARIGELLAVLRELVECKALHDEAETIAKRMFRKGEMARLRAIEPEYQRRKTVAWQNARLALASPDSAPTGRAG